MFSETFLGPFQILSGMPPQLFWLGVALDWDVGETVAVHKRCVGASQTSQKDLHRDFFFSSDLKG